MRETDLYRRCDEALGCLLAGEGFHTAKPAEYLRFAKGGEDRILVSRASASRSHTHFAIWMSHYPDYMNVLENMFRHLGEDRGFPCGPYLTPVGVQRREKYWPCKNVDVLKKSLDHVISCLIEVGLPWLDSLRDPIVFAENVDPAAVLSAGLANEVAGNHEIAAACYREMYSRLVRVMPTSTERQFLSEFARPYVFVATKLNIDKERREDYQRKLDYYPGILPLG